MQTISLCPKVYNDVKHYVSLYSQVNEDLNRMRLDAKGPRTAHLIHHLQGERDDARLEVQQLRLECESLRERLRVAREGREKEEEEEEEKIDMLSQQLQEVSL